MNKKDNIHVANAKLYGEIKSEIKFSSKVINPSGNETNEVFSDSERQDIFDMIFDGMTKEQIINIIHKW